MRAYAERNANEILRSSFSVCVFGWGYQWDWGFRYVSVEGMYALS